MFRENQKKTIYVPSAHLYYMLFTLSTKDGPVCVFLVSRSWHFRNANCVYRSAEREVKFGARERGIAIHLFDIGTREPGTQQRQN